MKKIISFSLIVFSLCVLVNCSPKTSKKTTTTNTEEINKKRIAEEKAKIAQESKEEKVAVTKAPESTSTPAINPVLSTMSTEQQLALFSDMAPLRVDVGKKIYTTHCNKCHGYYAPETRTANSWVDVMTSMGPKAKLKTDEYLMVAGYLVQNSKK